jgi:hypothetical protein
MDDTNNKVHVYKASREDRLQQLVTMLWFCLPEEERDALSPDIRDDGMGWAIPDDDRDRCIDDWLTYTEIGNELGLSPSTVRNWPDRYGLKPRRGRLKWSDVERVVNRRAV